MVKHKRRKKMELSELLEMVNNTDVLKAIADKLADAIPVNDLTARGSNPFIPDRADSNLPIIRIFS